MITDINFEQWLELNNYSPRTKRAYRLYFKSFKLLPTINQETINGFIMLHNNGACRGFVNGLIKYIIEREVDIPKEEMDVLLRVRVIKPLGKKKELVKKTIITKEDLDRIESVLKNGRNGIAKVILLLSYNCALRASEIFRIKLDSFNWDSWEKNMEGYGLLSLTETKTGKSDVVPVPSFIMKRIDQYVKEMLIEKPMMDFTNKHLFNLLDWEVNYESNERLWIKYIMMNYKNWEKTLKIASTKALGYSITSHCLRRSFATNMLNAGLNIREVQELLRHKDISSTQLYTQISKEQLVKRLEEVNNKINPQ